MSQIIPLEKIPRQSLTVQLDGLRYELRIVDIGGMMAIDVRIDDALVISGHRLLGNSPVIPYRYMESTGGNFMVVTADDEFPMWTEFGGTQYMTYMTAAEMAAFRGN